ncbi:nucleotide-diphospho-sugar transferase [Atractiella rhizophila]|nr:nucleotide-diphospho-sugar transferase [Atractiella rhizophila]
MASILSQTLSPPQSHLMTFFDSLSPPEQTQLQSEIASLDIPNINNIFSRAISESKASEGKPATNLTPPPANLFRSLVDDPSSASSWEPVGLKAIGEGKVGVLLLAGGQGTRLGSSAPKGCYDIGLPSGKSLFQIQAERIRKLQELGGGRKAIRWYVMTSGPTRKDTVDFFEKHKFWGLERENVIFFEQGTLPCFDTEGNILLQTKSTLTSAPDGNGGLYTALSRPQIPTSSGTISVLDDMTSHSIEYIHAYCVDNILVKVADPVFLGYCIQSKADCGAKVVRKTKPEESVGVVCLKDEKWAVVEYSEIPKEVSEKRDPDGKLSYRAANIANHFYSLSLLKSIPSFASQMTYHIASKKIPHVSLTTGEVVKPSKPNGIKLELFIFDVFPFVSPLEKMAVLEVPREEEFSPLKNAPGTGADDPGTSRRDLLEMQKRWLEKAGIDVAAKEVELSPNVTYAGEGLGELKGKKVVKEGKVETLQELRAFLD